MNRSELQSLADHRVQDAEALLGSERWQAAYYLLGYAVECALKACAARRFGEHEVPDKKVVLDFYTHDLEKLLNVAELKSMKEDRAKVDSGFKVNWSIVNQWSEASRYNLVISKAEAQDMFSAVNDPASGVLSWLRTVW